MALLFKFSPLFPAATSINRRRATSRTPLKHNRTSYFSAINCSNADPLRIGVPFNSSKPAADVSRSYTFTEINKNNVTAENLTRDQFPADFLWGAGTSAIQIEGDATEGGRGPSTGDYLINGKGVNSYHMYPEDVKLVKDMNMPCYRFSIAWPRILPEGTIDNINPEGIQYYHKLLDELEKNNIIPMATLFHFDMPQALKDKYGGFLDRRMIKDFTNYADLCFKTYGHRIKHWLTINEASTFILSTDCQLTDEQKIDGYSPYICLHNLLLAHASAYRLYEKEYKPVQQGEVGMAIATKGFVPHSDSDIDANSTEFASTFHMGCYFDPLCFGDYPEIMRVYVRDLPTFSDEEKQMLKQSFDFLGINNYIGVYIEARFHSLVLMQDGKTRMVLDSVERFEKDGIPIGPRAPALYPFYICPDGLKKLLYSLKDKYNNPKMYITETGCPSRPDIKMSLQQSIASGNTAEILAEFNDDQRLGYIRDHLLVICQAIQDKVNVNGFIVWSLMDNTEFGSNEVRFGLNFVDYYDNYKRYPRKSALWFKGFLCPEETTIQSNEVRSSTPISANTLPLAPVTANTPPLPVTTNAQPPVQVNYVEQH